MQKSQTQMLIFCILFTWINHTQQFYKMEKSNNSNSMRHSFISLICPSLSLLEGNGNTHTYSEREGERVSCCVAFQANVSLDWLQEVKHKSGHDRNQFTVGLCLTAHWTTIFKRYAHKSPCKQTMTTSNLSVHTRYQNYIPFLNENFILFLFFFRGGGSQIEP